MSFLGDIQDLSIPEILQTLGYGKHSGLLSLSGDKRKGRIMLNHGCVVYASSNFSSRLGYNLVRKGLITVEDFKKVIREQKKMQGKVAMGTILIERGFLSWELLENEVRDQILRVFDDVFSWQRGVFHFQKNNHPGTCLILRDGFKVDYLLLEYLKGRDESIFGPGPHQIAIFPAHAIHGFEQAV